VVALGTEAMASSSRSHRKPGPFFGRRSELEVSGALAIELLRALDAREGNLVAQLQARGRVLLVLDKFEQLVHEAALLGELLERRTGRVISGDVAREPRRRPLRRRHAAASSRCPAAPRARDVIAEVVRARDPVSSKTDGGSAFVVTSGTIWSLARRARHLVTVCELAKGAPLPHGAAELLSRDHRPVEGAVMRVVERGRFMARTLRRRARLWRNR
jgi:hypothetical protein